MKCSINGENFINLLVSSMKLFKFEVICAYNIKINAITLHLTLVFHNPNMAMFIIIVDQNTFGCDMLNFSYCTYRYYRKLNGVHNDYLCSTFGLPL